MGRNVPAVDRALSIIELFLQGESTLSAPDVTRRLQLPRSTTHELLTTLEARRYLKSVPDRPGRYQLGVRLYQLGGRYEEQVDLVGAGQVIADEIAGVCGETVRVAILEGAEVIDIAKVDTRNALRMVLAVGHRFPAHCTAAGKVLLASLPVTDLETHLGTIDLTALTPHSITAPAALQDALARIRVRGVATERREAHPHINAVAAPVRDVSGEVIAALSIAAPVTRWNETREQELAEQATLGADSLSVRLGYQGIL